MFWLFMGDFYYPGGGYSDFHQSFDTLDEAQTVAVKQVKDEDDADWAQILEVQNNKPVYQWDLVTGTYEWEETDRSN